MLDSAMLAFLLPPFVASLILTGIHAYLGVHVVERGVIFVDLSLAQIAALGATIAILLPISGGDPHAPIVYWVSLAFTFLGALVFSTIRAKRARIPQEAIIGICYAVASAAAILAMFWSSRKHMDVPIMTLPLVLVGLDLARTRRLREATLFALLGLTLWAPLRDDQWALPVVVVADTLIWLAAGWYILFGRAAQRWTGEPTPVTGRASPR